MKKRFKINMKETTFEQIRGDKHAVPTSVGKEP
jgi:hypothetical protein